MPYTPQIKIPAVYMRGGTSKGVLFNRADLPAAAQMPGAVRDAVLLRVIGSPDPYGKHTDGMGGATSSTSKAAIVSESTQPDHDVDYLFGQISIDQPRIDWSGNCGNLSAAVGAFAISRGLIKRDCLPDHGIAKVRIWQANIGKTIISHIPVICGEVQEMGGFELDGVAFPAAEIQLDFMHPVEGDREMFPTGNLVDDLEVPGMGVFKATMVNAGIPTIFVNAQDIGYTGTELQHDINNDNMALQRFEAIRACGAVQMGLIQDVKQAAQRQHTPKIACIARPVSYTASNGKKIKADDIDLLVRAVSMGRLHHAMMGTAAIAIGAAAAVPGTLVNLAAGGGVRESSVFGHPSGTLKVGAQVVEAGGKWTVVKASMSRSARTLMEGMVCIPEDVLSNS